VTKAFVTSPMPWVKSMLVLHPSMMICRAGMAVALVGVRVLTGVSVACTLFVLVGKKVGVMVDVAMTGVADVFVTPMITGVGE